MRCLQCAGSDWAVDSICFQVKAFRFSQTTTFFLDFWKWQFIVIKKNPLRTENVSPVAKKSIYHLKQRGQNQAVSHCLAKFSKTCLHRKTTQNPQIHQQGQDEWKLEGKLAILQNKHDRIGQYLTNDLKKNVIVTVVCVSSAQKSCQINIFQIKRDHVLVQSHLLSFIWSQECTEQLCSSIKSKGVHI